MLSRLRAKFGPEIREVALGSEEGLGARSGVLFPPVVFLDGEPCSYGRLSERKLRKALAAQPA